jgi:hypothetical protein
MAKVTSPCEFDPVPSHEECSHSFAGLFRARTADWNVSAFDILATSVEETSESFQGEPDLDLAMRVPLQAIGLPSIRAVTRPRENCDAFSCSPRSSAYYTDEYLSLAFLPPPAIAMCTDWKLL